MLTPFRRRGLLLLDLDVTFIIIRATGIKIEE
jgi:hypothetical protein